MIKIERLEIVNFRGIKHLDLDVGKENFVIAGRNGTGKSGIIDAIEFVLTGKISRLEGSGTFGLSVKAHGPHVDSAAVPASSEVTIWVTRGAVQLKLSRSPASATVVTLDPDDAQSRGVVSWMASHPEFALSRRELLKFVVGEASGRADEVETLLKLEKVRAVRALLQKVSNAEGKNQKAAADSLSSSRRALEGSLGSQFANDEQFTAAVNAQRLAAGLGPRNAFATRTDILSDDEGLLEVESTANYRATWLRDIGAAELSLTALTPEAFQRLEAAVGKADELAGESETVLALDAEKFLAEALRRFDGEQCPVCLTDWESSAFEELVSNRRDLSSRAKERLRAVAKELVSALFPFNGLNQTVSTIGNWLPRLDNSREFALSSVQAQLGETVTALKDVQSPENLQVAVAVATPTREAMLSALAEARQAVEALPLRSEQATALGTLRETSVRYEAFVRHTEVEELAGISAARAARTFGLFEETRNEYLNQVYANVQSEFARLYSLINEDDESAFVARFTPKGAGLDLQVDFYGRGLVPPAAYHSEGH